MVSGAGMVFVWNLLVRPLGGLWDIYELLPAFIFSSICIVVVSLLTPTKIFIQRIKSLKRLDLNNDP